MKERAKTETILLYRDCFELQAKMKKFQLLYPPLLQFKQHSTEDDESSFHLCPRAQMKSILMENGQKPLMVKTPCKLLTMVYSCLQRSATQRFCQKLTLCTAMELSLCAPACFFFSYSPFTASVMVNSSRLFTSYSIGTSTIHTVDATRLDKTGVDEMSIRQTGIR